MTELNSTSDEALGASVFDEIELRDEGASRLRSLLDDSLWWLLALGLLTTVGGLIGVFLSLSRVRPEVQVHRQIPYLVSSVAFGSIVVLGGLLCLLYLLWRVFGSFRALMMELEEAAAAMLWSSAIEAAGRVDEADATATNGVRQRPAPRRTRPIRQG